MIWLAIVSFVGISLDAPAGWKTVTHHEADGDVLQLQHQRKSGTRDLVTLTAHHHEHASLAAMMAELSVNAEDIAKTTDARAKWGDVTWTVRELSDEHETRWWGMATKGGVNYTLTAGARADEVATVRAALVSIRLR
jgi:hypothetical protein